MAHCVVVAIPTMLVAILPVAFGAAMVSERHAQPAGGRREALHWYGECNRQQHKHAGEPGAHAGHSNHAAYRLTIANLVQMTPRVTTPIKKAAKRKGT
jgi:hypothetical protein